MSFWFLNVLVQRKYSIDQRQMLFRLVSARPVWEKIQFQISMTNSILPVKKKKKEKKTIFLVLFQKAAKLFYNARINRK